MSSKKVREEGFSKDADKLVRRLSLVALLLSRRGQPVSVAQIRCSVEGYPTMTEDAFKRRFYGWMWPKYTAHAPSHRLREKREPIGRRQAPRPPPRRLLGRQVPRLLAAAPSQQIASRVTRPGAAAQPLPPTARTEVA